MECKKYKIGYTCGVFDLLHIGHLNLLENCKKYCDELIVGVCSDEYVRVIKKKEPIIPIQDRIRLLEALKCVDRAIEVSIEETEDKMLILSKLHFNVLFSGDDWKGTERYVKTEKLFSMQGVHIIYLPYTRGISTTELKDKIHEQGNAY